MTAVTFDTLASVKRLVAAGMTPEQAEAVVEVFRNAQFLQELATKDDLRFLGQELEKDMAALRSDLSTMETRLNKAVYKQGYLVIAALSALIFFTEFILKTH